MCGIAGFYGQGGLDDIQKMTDSLRHRGPDEGQTLVTGPVALGHRRLSILDIAHGQQPMQDPVSGMIIVYNGEIYNHASIRRELEKLGHIFQTSHSDTETVLHAFVEWGRDCFIRFNGMFALAIYDPSAKKIWLARDRFGEKPLFYCKTGAGFAFASEIRALRLWPGFPGRWNKANIQRFFAWNYLPGGRCASQDCHSLAPGSWLCYDLAAKESETMRWWSFELEPDEALKDSAEPELAEELRRLLVNAVRLRLLSDAPLGIFLSGGLDSSAILAAACQVADPHDLQTFSIGFREKSFDESGKAQKVARHLQVPNLTETLTEEVMAGSIDHILSQMSEPFGDASLIPTWHLCAFARKHVKVALSGDGGDELLGGYDPLEAIGPAFWYERVMPKGLHSCLRLLANLLPASDRNMSLEFKLKRFLRGMSWPEDMRIAVWMSGLDPDEIREFFYQPLTDSQLFADALALGRAHPSLTPLEKAFMFFTCLYLTDDILVKSDRASMMVSLETRAVFLDNELADFCRKLPMRFKYRNGQRKYLLKKALAGWLPEEILKQPKKGFGIPLNLWLRSLPAPKHHVPGMKKDAPEKCRLQHLQRHGDYRYFLWDLQAFSRLGDAC